MLRWNIRGVNSDKKWNSIHDKLECHCDVLCRNQLEHFDLQFLRSFCPHSFDQFEILLSLGALGGLFIAWRDHLLGSLAFQNSFSISVEFTSRFDNSSWFLTNAMAHV